MPIHRFFLPDPLITNVLVLPMSESHHLEHVMRVKVGQTVEIINGKGTLAQAVVVQYEKKQAFLSVTSTVQEKAAAYELILAQALIRPALLDWTVEKATELGATKIWLFPADFSEKKELSSSQQHRLSHLMISALKQSGRLYLPDLEIKPTLHQWKNREELLLFGSLDTSHPPLSSLIKQSIIMVIGPEKGFSQEEKSTLKSLSAVGISLSDATLRTETAGVCAVSILSYLQRL